MLGHGYLMQPYELSQTIFQTAILVRVGRLSQMPGHAGILLEDPCLHANPSGGETLSADLAIAPVSANCHFAKMNTISITNREETEARAFREQCRRQMARPLEARMKFGWCRVHRPVLDVPGVRVFSSTREYREWCAANLPAYLGYQPAPAE